MTVQRERTEGPRRALRTATILALTLLLPGVAGCATSSAPGATPAETPTASSPPADASPTPAETPAPTETEPALTASVPAGCDELLPLAELEGWDGWTTADTDQLSYELPGPAARAAAENATDSLTCRWLPELATESYLLGFAYSLEPQTRTELVDALAASTQYATADVRGADSAFSIEKIGGDIVFATLYAFVDDVWIVLSAPGSTYTLAELAGEAAEGLRG